MIQIHKQLAVKEDLELGFGEVTQPRDDGKGALKNFTYHKINAGVIPIKDSAGADSDTQTEMDKRMEITDADAKFALKQGDASITFKAAPATDDAEVVNKKQMTDEITASVSIITNNYVKKTDVLTKTNTDPFTPAGDYQPATKLYVDNKVVQVGAGDMAKAAYDKNDNGVVDNSEAIGGQPFNSVFTVKPSISDANSVMDMGLSEGSDITNGAFKGNSAVATFPAANGLSMQLSFGASGDTASRVYDGTQWTSWKAPLSKDDIVSGFAGGKDKAASAEDVKSLHNAVQGLEGVPVGTIVMFGGNASTIPNDWAICDGTGGTPNLVDKFIKGTADPSKIGTTGGTKEATMPDHSHSITHNHPGAKTRASGNHKHLITHSHDIGAHTHSMNHTHTNNTHNHHGMYMVRSGNNLGMKEEWLPVGTSGDRRNFAVFGGGHGDPNIQDYGETTKTVSQSPTSTGTASGKTGTYSGSSADGGAHTHAVDIPYSNSNSGIAKSGGNNEPPFYVLMYIMKVR